MRVFVLHDDVERLDTRLLPNCPAKRVLERLHGRGFIAECGGVIHLEQDTDG